MRIYFKLVFSFEGGLAQLARALDLHSRGHRFDSDILHDSIGYFGFERVIVIQHSLLFRVRFSCLTRDTFIDILKRYKKYQSIFFTCHKWFSRENRFIRANNNKVVNFLDTISKRKSKKVTIG